MGCNYTTPEVSEPTPEPTETTEPFNPWPVVIAIIVISLIIIAIIVVFRYILFKRHQKSEPKVLLNAKSSSVESTSSTSSKTSLTGSTRKGHSVSDQIQRHHNIKLGAVDGSETQMKTSPKSVSTKRQLSPKSSRSVRFEKRTKPSDKRNKTSHNK